MPMYAKRKVGRKKLTGKQSEGTQRKLSKFYYEAFF